MDSLSPRQRSERMSRVRGKDTKPEMIVRRFVHGLGYRYRLHCTDLLGKPDLVFRPRGKIIFVHGCFWHQHDDENCALSRLPKSRQSFWLPKLERNRERDLENQRKLQCLGWQILVVWECELRNREELEFKLKEFLK